MKLSVAFFLTLTASLLMVKLVFGEQDPIKFGKISDEELQMTVYAKDTAATAVVLCDYGVSEFVYTDAEGLRYKFTRNTRIKIFKKEGYEWAKFQILLSKKYDKIGSIKAITYNQKNGKTVKVKLDNDQKFTEDYNKYYDFLKFEMPAVKEGSILDVEYSITSESYRFDDWYFQTGIPTIYSEYRASIPEYFYYKQLEKGFFPIGAKTTNTRMVKQTGNEKTRSSGGGFSSTQTSFEKYSFDYQVTDFKFVSRDIPAFYTEEYITSRENYISCLQFELGSIKWPNQPVKNYTSTWEALGKELMDDPDFGSRATAGGIIKDELTLIETLNTTPEAKIDAAYQLIRSKMSWDGRNSIYSFDHNKAWKEGKGSSGDINLLLVSALSRLGFEANPVILSTRSNGFVHPAQIILDQFNYVIAAVKLNDKLILLDATDKKVPFGILPERCLNGQGRMIDEKGGSWVDIKPLASQKQIVQVKMNLKPDGSLDGTITEKYEGYAAIDKRNELSFYTSDADYLKEYQKSFDKLNMEPDSITDKLSLAKPITINYHIESEDLFDKAGELLFINPTIINKRTTNPFKLEKRDYPVDFSCLKSATYMANINIPEGLAVDNLPASKKMILPEKTASFTYSVQQSGNTIFVVSKFDINKVTFLPAEYLDLKEFYNQMIEVLSKQIVLKKI
ncbi:MAG: DUF3857 domain-containing protein [Salinivirgaceae bacterium]